MEKKSGSFRFGEVVGALCFIAMMCTVAYGWVYNIVSLVGMGWDVALGVESMLRIIGIVVVPLGAVMGIFV